MFARLLPYATKALLLVVFLPFGALRAESGTTAAPPTSPPPNFQPYIFWAYALVCIFLFIFTLWSVVQTRRIGNQVEWLKRRLEEVETAPRQGAGDKPPHSEE